MSAQDAVLREFDAEMATTRRLLERVPVDRLDWKPHPKSRSLGELATHVAELPRWGVRFSKDTWQIGSEPPPVLRTAEEFLRRFDENVAASREGIARATEEQLRGDFTLLKPDGRLFFRLPRAGVLRAFLLSHIIHHRGQLTVYYRLNDVPLPSVYGPTADESV